MHFLLDVQRVRSSAGHEQPVGPHLSRLFPPILRGGRRRRRGAGGSDAGGGGSGGERHVAGDVAPLVQAAQKGHGSWHQLQPCTGKSYF